jgi:hypothetical protein
VLLGHPALVHRGLEDGLDALSRLPLVSGTGFQQKIRVRMPIPA